ncbi:MAG: hypothetical protein KBF66_14205 [Rhodoferax sp.]|uniref:hypothetical protein n=1 Tax=Rhodoferax sp. TaxID=50421 RepID=UPI001B5164A8|nr:hypothetical protein [Rhodoferax sp.]MBP9906710.1 hypothetical protein [Rhodoferax sp.]
MNRFSMVGPPTSVAMLLLLCATAAFAQPRYDRDRYRHGHSEDCHFYAREQSHRYAPPGAGALSGAARGAVGGAIFGGIVGGGRGAGRGAAAGAALGLIANGARNNADREDAYRRAYDDCMRGWRR